MGRATDDPGGGVSHGVTAWAAATPDKPALVLDGVTRTYGEVDQRTTRLAHALSALGAGPQQTVAAVLPNGFEFFEVAVASSKLGATFLPVNWHLKADELAWILEDAGAAVVVAHESLVEHVDAALARATQCQRLVVGGDGVDEYERALDAHADRPALVSPASWSPMFYTSGTTGRPKGVVHGYLDPERTKMSQLGLVQLWGWRPDDVYALSGPAYHAGPGGFVTTAMFVGATTTILPAWDAREWLQLVERDRVTLSFMVPAHFIRILEVPEEERAQFDLSSLRLLVHAAAPCPIAVKERAMDALPGEIWELYGASEGGATRISPDEWRERPGSVGLPWPGVEVRILDADGRRLGAGESGLIYVAPAGGARFHYHDDAEKTDEAWRDDAFTVGDVGHLDEDGYLYITDRAVDMVIRGGVNVYPREVEEVLYRHPGVVDCAVFGVPDERLGERLKAVVETRDGVDAEELRRFCREHLADFKVPEIVELVETLPRDPNGKVLKRRLRDAAWEGRTTAVG